MRNFENDMYKMNFKYVPGFTDDGGLEINTYMNDMLIRQVKLEEEVLTGAVVDWLRLNGYTVIEPGGVE